ncbi:UDP-glucuronosyltransferase 2B13 isoform X2 [Nematostella vectensis]|uniref:UDP-glucuronosyltransferase 2B13 isoform X2 n=1 Tax=Nematostella vectensis TaxID=45351 RepID=UPI00207737B1|nr:UDP-glucuronosyltransferase 2B13 isoform X2 [Nematostella vectensis]
MIIDRMFGLPVVFQSRRLLVGLPVVERFKMAARAAFCTAVFQSIAILLMSQSSSSAKIAVLVIPNGISHFYMMEPIGQELEARGHEVTYIMCSMEPKLYTINARRILIYDVKHPVNALVEASALKLARTGSLSWPNAVKVLDILSDACDTVLSNQNVKVIGSPSQRQAMKLPREFEDFIASAEHGVVLVSFGSMVMSLDDAVVSKLANVFSKLKYKVIIKFGDSFPKTDNVMLVKWMPQNDILANSNVKLFITHGGANSVYEGCGHGVPLLVTPLFSDQFGYGEKVKAAGLGISVSLKESTAEEMIKNINELIEKPCYKENALRVSRLMEDKPQTPQQEGAFWIEYVIRNNGTQHLRPSGRDLPFYQYFLLDVMLFFGTIISIFVFMLVKCLKVVRFKSGLSTVKRKEE